MSTIDYLPAGVHTISAGAYHADPTERPSLSASIATILCTSSPAHARAAHPRLNPEHAREEKEHFDIGTIAHALLLEGQTAVEVILADDWRTKVAKEARDDARAAGRIPLLSKHWDAVQAMVDATRAQLVAVGADPPLFTEGKYEQTLIWEDEGVLCRSRLDWLRDDLAACDDLKTSSNANPEVWSRRALFDNGCDIQAAMYLRGIKALTGATPAWRFVVVEKTPPYALSVITPGPDILAVAEAKVEYALRRWKQCLDTGVWPAYPAEVYRAELPAWADDAKWLVDDYRDAA